MAAARAQLAPRELRRRPAANTRVRQAMSRTSLHVAGVVCGGCVDVVERAISAVDGVSNCAVDLSGRTSVDGDAATATIIAAVRSTGRTAVVVAEGDPAPLVLRVGGMTCGHCSAQVEQALAAVAGVTT